jgi:putative DNA primase/helicase
MAPIPQARPPSAGSAQLSAALAYAARGWPVFPVGSNKVPLTEHGRSDVTDSPAQIRQWWAQWPNASIAIATGAKAGIVALDVDVSELVYGPDSLDALGVSLHPETPTAHTPRGGFHVLFAHPGRFVKTIAGRLGPGLDIRGDGGSLILPPGPGRSWDPVLNLDTVPIAPMPDWMIIPEPARIGPGYAPKLKVRLSRYAEGALDSAVLRIVTAGAGEQEVTLNAEVFSIGRLAGTGVIPACLALDAVLLAARKMPTHDPRHPWRLTDLERKVRLAFTAGLANRRPCA